MRYGQLSTGRKYRYGKGVVGRQYACTSCGNYLKGADNSSGSFICRECSNKRKELSGVQHLFGKEVVSTGAR